MSRVIQYSGSSKFDIAQLRDLNPQLLTRLRDTSNTTGMLEERNALFCAMYDLWDVLKKDTDTIASAVRALTFSVVPYADEGKDPSANAQKAAKVVEAALWQRKVTKPGEWGHSFLEMVEAMTHARHRGVTVHEIELARTKDLVYAAVYHPILPQFYGWETEEGKPDRLLMFPDGQQWSGKGKPFPAHKFIIAINTTGPDHPLFNNTYQALVGWFGAAMWGKTWFLQYCNRFGKPVTIYTVPDEVQAQKKRAELLANPSVTDIVKVGDQTKVEVMSAAGGASLPQAELLKMAEAACHKLILGQTLTSDTSDNGGSLAQAKVHAGVQKTEELKLGEWVCEILNAQLVPAIVAWNFGRVEGIELPEIRCAMPDAQMNMAKIEYYKALKELGAEIPKAKFYDDLGIPVPEKGEETMGWEKGDTPPDGGGTPFGGNTPQGGGKPPAQGQQGGKDGNAPQNTRDRKDGKDENTEAARNSGGKKPVAEMTDEELEAELTELERKRQARLDAELKEAEDMADDVYAEWLAPATEWLQKAAEGKVTQAEFRKALEEGKIQLNTRVLADALYEAAAKPLRRARGEHVSAKRHKSRNTSGKVSGNCLRHEQGPPCKRHDKKPTATPATNDRNENKRTAAAAVQAVHSALENPDESTPPLFIISKLKENGEEEEFEAFKLGVRDGAARGDFTFTTVNEKGQTFNAKLTQRFTKHLDDKGDEGDMRYADLPNIIKTVKSPDEKPEKQGSDLVYRKTFEVPISGKKRTRHVVFRVILNENGEFVSGYKEETEKAFKAKQKRK